MSASTCPIDVPADPAALSGPPILRPEGLPEWGLPQLKALKHTHRWQFAPSNYSADGWKEAIYASQFRADCSRLLLVEDDLTKAGLGFTAKIWNVALLLAMRDNRVLVEVRMIKVGNTTPRRLERRAGAIGRRTRCSASTSRGRTARCPGRTRQKSDRAGGH